MPSHIEVKNFEKFQHYKDRMPPWIKLYNELLDDYEFSRLQDASKLHLVMIWLLASRYENRIPNDAVWIARRINATEPVKLDCLVKAGFIRICGDASTALAESKQDAMPETEEETEDTNVSLSGKPDPIGAVWKHWVHVSDRPKSKLLKNRRQKIRARLRTYSEEELRRAIDSAHRNPFYLGDNARGTYYGDIETIFKSDEAVSRHLAWADEHPPGMRNGNGRHLHVIIEHDPNEEAA